jgi:hypothetical protein
MLFEDPGATVPLRHMATPVTLAAAGGANPDIPLPNPRPSPLPVNHAPAFMNTPNSFRSSTARPALLSGVPCLRVLLQVLCGMVLAWAASPELNAAAPPMSQASLLNYLSTPKRANGAIYNTTDSMGQLMQEISVIDLVGQGAWRYAAVYHVPTLVSGGFRYKVALALSTDLLHWTYWRTLVDNADMAEITTVTNGAWIILTHEQWMGQGLGGASQGPCQVGFELYFTSSDLLNGTIRSSWIAPQYLNPFDGTPNFYDAHLALYGGYWCVDATVGFHFFTGNTDSLASSTVTHLFDPAVPSQTVSYPSTAAAYNNLFIKSGYRDIGERTNILVSSGRYNVQEVHSGEAGADWDLWRVFLYTFGDSYVFPTGNGTVLQLSPQTPNGSYSIGGPKVSLVKSPSSNGNAIVISYFIFAEGAGAGEAGNLLYYYNF